MEESVYFNVYDIILPVTLAVASLGVSHNVTDFRADSTPT